MERAETTLVRYRLPRSIPSQSRREAAGYPPEGATIIEGNAAIIDAASDEVIAVQSVVAVGAANELAQLLHGVKWRVAKTKKGKAVTEARLSGMAASHATFGYLFPQPVRRRYACCTTGFSRNYPEASDILTEVAVTGNRLFKATARAVYNKTTKAVYERIADPWRMADSPWTSGIINNNAALPYHRDSGNIPESWSAMFTCRSNCEGGYLHLADYDVYLALPNGSISIFDGQSVLHGVTPFHLTKPQGHRYTAVFYSPSRMAGCAPTREQEPLYAQRRATEAEERRRRPK